MAVRYRRDEDAYADALKAGQRRERESLRATGTEKALTTQVAQQAAEDSTFAKELAEQLQVELGPLPGQIQDALDAADAAQITADGKSTVVRSTSAATGAGSYKLGDQWWQFSGANIVGLWLHDGGAWVSQALTDAIIATLDAAKITTGTLSADRIGALSISSAKIAAGAIIADKIAAGAITTGKLAADAIDGMTITGAVIRTAATGQRLQLDVNGLRAYNAANQVVATMLASTAGFNLSGVLGSGGVSSASVYQGANDTAAGIWLTAQRNTGVAVANSASLQAGTHKSNGAALNLGVADSMMATIKASENGSGYRELWIFAGASDADIRLEASKVNIAATDLTHNGNPITSVVTETTLTAASGTTVAGTSVIVKDNLGLVQFNVIGTRTSWTTGGTTTIGTFPAGCRPSATVTVPVVVYGAGTPYLSFGQITAGGLFILYKSPTNGQSWTVALVGMLKAA